MRPEGRDSELENTLRALANNTEDEAAWVSLYRLMWPFAVASCYRSLGPILRDLLCEDAAQEAFMRLLALPNLPTFEKGAPQFRGYFGTICENVARDLLKSAKRRETRQQNAAPTIATPSHEEEAYVAEIRNNLNDEDRALFDLLEKGHTLAEIAHQLGTSISTADRRKKDLLEKLHKAME